MIELPESHTLAKQLYQVLLNKIVDDVVAAQSPHGFAWYNGDPSNYVYMLKGKCITCAEAYGGQVELLLEDMRLVFHDGVNIRYLEKDAPLPKKHQLYMRFTDGSGIVCTVQMYGGMMAFPVGTYDNTYYLCSVAKPSPYTNEFDEAYFMHIVENGGAKLSAKALLATEQRIPGLGNGCTQDILYLSNIHPQSKIGHLTDNELETLFHTMKSTLLVMREQGGRNTEKDIFGNPGGYRTLLSSKTLNYPCMRCGGIIQRNAYLGGNIYFCEHCQRQV